MTLNLSALKSTAVNKSGAYSISLTFDQGYMIDRPIQVFIWASGSPCAGDTPSPPLGCAWSRKFRFRISALAGVWSPDLAVRLMAVRYHALDYVRTAPPPFDLHFCHFSRPT